ncbi:plasma membrane fusion protein prm1 [Rhizophlyctis rosea]|uniref:Plasma membrane fusion protein PRM1 n=1 Tax=Rhizophlyctis rosea TaxID=64517 RepID=A0AAD5SRI9_9FUNG|nr:plasma membrane fusion protein prm1 [Rhizophlyctis rosea]
MPSFNHHTDPFADSNRYDIRKFQRLEDSQDIEENNSDIPTLISFHEPLATRSRTRPVASTPPPSSPAADSPYPSLRALLTRAYASNFTASLILVLTTLFLLLQSLSGLSVTTKARLTSSCASLEAASTAVASIPHYSAKAFNELTVETADSLVRHLSGALVGAVELLRFLVIFLLRRWQRLLLCLIDMIIQAGVNTISMYAEQITAFLNTQLASIQSALSDGLRTLEGTSRDLLSKIPNIFNPNGGSFTMPTVSDKLNFQIPQDFVDKLKNLKTKVPTLELVEAKITDVISVPFVKLEDLIKGNINSAKLVDPARFQIAAPEPKMVHFCAEKMDLSWVDKMQKALQTSLTIGAVLLILLFILAVIANAYLIRRQYHRFEEHVQATGRLIQTSSTTTRILTESDSESLAREQLHAAVNPFTHRITTKLTGRIRSSRHKTRTQWFLHYVSHRPSMMCLVMGLTGLITIGIQLALLSRAQQSVIPTLAEDLHATGIQVATAVHGAMVDASHPYVMELNTSIDQTERDINDHMFGWVNGTIEAISNTLSTFTNGFNDVVELALSDVPPLRDAVIGFGNCLLGGTVESMQEAANALRNRLSVHFPRVNDSAIVNIQPGDVDAILARVATVSDGGQVPVGKEQKVAEGFLEVELNKMVEMYKSVLRSNLVPFIVLTVFGSGVLIMGSVRCLLWVVLRK